MNCELAQEHIVLAVYGELADDRIHQLEQHLATCEPCREEFEAVSALQKAMSVLPVVDPSPSLLARTRLRLDESLDAIPHGGLLRRAFQAFGRGAGRLQSAPVMTSALLIAGLAVGAGAGYRIGFRNASAQQPPVASTQHSTGTTYVPDPANASIAGVSSIILEPNTENVEVRFDRLVPETAYGTLDDPQIRQLLLAGARGRADVTAHDHSVSLLAQECRVGHACTDAGPIRKTLMQSLRYDKNASVRLKALQGLEPYIAVDMSVRDAILEALLKDPDAQVRSQAISLLAPVEADSTVREVLHTVASQDQNPHIRDVSRQFLEQVSQIQ